MGHASEGSATRRPQTPPARIDALTAKAVAVTLQALAAPSRLRILARLREGPCSVSELADAVAMEQSAVSHQLRLLRHLGLVVGERTGRSVVYALYDHHVAMLLDEAVYHAEHLRLGVHDPLGQPAESATATPDQSSAPLPIGVVGDRRR